MATHYTIMRGEKRNTSVMNGIVKHIARAQETPNADAKKRHLNYTVLGPGWDDLEGIHEAIEARTPTKYRKDAVRVIEYIVSASPEWFYQNPDREREYFQTAAEWFKSEFGAENVVSAVVHNDESSPHMHLLVVPRDESSGKPKLNAKVLFGNKGVLRRRQSEFSDAMSHFGVERGKADPERRHTKVRDWRAGHSQLDEREASLRDREKVASAQLQEAHTFHGDAREQLQNARQAEEENEALAQQLEERERAVQALSERLKGLQQAVERREAAVAERERRLASLEEQLEARGERLQGGEAALAQRQAEIDRAGEKLRQRLAEARQQEQEQQAWEARRDAWLAENRPPAVPELVRHLRRLQSLSVLDAAEYLDEQDSDELYTAFTPQGGLTPQGKSLLAQYEGAAEQRQRWERTMEPPKGGSKGPGL